MTVLLALRLDEKTENLVLDERIAYRPDLTRKDPAALARALVALRPDVLITNRYPDASVGAAWRESAPQRTLVAIATDSDEVYPELAGMGIITEHFQAPNGEGSNLGVFALAERIWTREGTCADLPRKLTSVRASGGRSVAVVGAGVVNLITALHLLRGGYEVDIYDACPDPRKGFVWSDYGCTRGGDNARMFTLTEADDYHDKDYVPSGSPNAIFDYPVSEGGWRVCHSPSLEEMEWVDEFQAVSPWLARAYTNDILHFNREGGVGWRDLMKREASLFEGVELREGILRLYTQHDHFRSQVARQDRLGATRRVLSVPDIAARHPALAGACEGEELVGGIEVVGFTVGIHDFVERILAQLERGGVGLHWSSSVDGISWSSTGAAEGLMVEGGLVSADHYVLSPGAYGADLLRGTASEGLIHGVLGVWLTLPNPFPTLEHSLKIARRGHLAEDANVTVGRDSDGRSVLIVGSGYGWTGADPGNIDPMQIDALHEAVDDTARCFFPEAYLVAQENGMLEESRRFCVRPWTASNLPVFEIREASGGGALIVTGGHNTGGFAQAPTVAAAVDAALRGERHPMHVDYDPRRLRSLRGRVDVPAAALA